VDGRDMIDNIIIESILIQAIIDNIIIEPIIDNIHVKAIITDPIIDPDRRSNKDIMLLFKLSSLDKRDPDQSSPQLQCCYPFPGVL
jgi:hypothetical protein